MLGAVLLIGIPVEFVTGLLSYAAYNPLLGGNDPNPGHGVLGFYLFTWGPTPAWGYHAVESLHVLLGLALVPVVLGKLWSVAPKLFRGPLVRSPAHLLERLSLLLLVGGAVFQATTGILNIDYFQIEGFSFYTGHFFGAWVFMAAFVMHAVLKGPAMVRALRSRRLSAELRTGVADTRPEPEGEADLSGGAADDSRDDSRTSAGGAPTDADSLAPATAPPTISRRGVLALIGGTSLAVVVFTAGEAVGGPLRPLALFGTRQQASDPGPNDFPVNHTAAGAGITTAGTGADWRLSLVGPRTVTLSRPDLLRMRLTTADISLTCTEGWSTTQRWTGVPLASLAAMTGATRVDTAEVECLDGGSLMLAGAQVRSGTLVAMLVNGTDLSADHGYPARLVIPSAPGNYNRKWLRRITFFQEGSNG